MKGKCGPNNNKGHGGNRNPLTSPVGTIGLDPATSIILMCLKLLLIFTIAY
jgi:hypothetical protein